MNVFGFFDLLSPPTIIIVAVIAILLYGERLPEVARNFGKQFTDLKKSIQGLRDEFEAAARSVTTSVEESLTSATTASDPNRHEATAPKFEPPPMELAAEPQASTSTSTSEGQPSPQVPVEPVSHS